MTGYWLIAPEILLIAAVAWALFAERLPGGDRSAPWVGFVLAIAAGALSALATTGAAYFGDLIVVDAAARFARVAIAAITALWMLWTAGRGRGRIREAVALALLSAIGCLLMASAQEIVTIVLALELATMPAYVLIGYRRWRVSGLEGALKYFLLSMLTTLVMLYGLSFVYGLTGTTRLAELDLSGTGALGILAVTLTLVGLLAKLSAAPFHYWAPDAYEGAESWSVAFVSTVPKLAGAVAVVRFVLALADSSAGLGPALLVASVTSMVLGNLAALSQDDVRRMMAYSGVAHTGYLLLAAATLSPSGYGAAVFYAAAYALPSLGVMLVAAEVGDRVSDFGSAAARRPVVAWSVVAMLVSLIGIPPLLGFFGKLYLFGTAVDAGLGVWVVLAVAMSVVSAAYYLRIVRAMFATDSEQGSTEVRGSVAADAAIIATAVLTFALGLAAGPLFSALGALMP